MKIKFLLPLLFLISCISAQSQISVTVQSGFGQTFIDEDVDFNKMPNFLLGPEGPSLSSYNERSSLFFAVYASTPLAEKWKVQVGIESIRANLINYYVWGTSNEFHNRFKAKKNKGIEIGFTSFPINLIREEFLWKDKLYASVKAGFSLSYPFRSRIFDNSFYPEFAYGAQNGDSAEFDFLFSRNSTKGRNEIFFLNSAVAAGWKFNDRLRLECGLHYRHGCVPVLAIETTLFSDVEIPYPDNNSDYAIRHYGRNAYNNTTPNSRHAFTTNGTALFGTLALTYTFAKKENEKKQ